MKKTLLSASMLALSAGTAFAGGIDRSGQGVNILFEDGDFAQFSFAGVNPSIDGDGAAGPTNDIAPFYSSPSFGYKHQATDNIDIALIYDRPYGAHVHYPTLGGAGADIYSQAVTGIVKYKFDNGISVYGGARAMKVGGEILSTPGLLDAHGDYGYGGLVGVAYEKPEIAMRVALTYNSAQSVNLKGVHVNPVGPVVTPQDFDVEFPESVNLDFQTGVAPNTLVYGTVRWVGWDGFNLTDESGTEWVAFSEDTITYSFGVGRQITEKLSLALNVGHEKSTGSVTDTLLAPSSGSTSVGIGATYQVSEKMTISGGLNYIWLGDTQYDMGGGNWQYFEDNTAIALGARVGMQF